MTRYIRSVYFTETPLKGKFRFGDVFQIFPINSKKAPVSFYAEHYPFFLEYTIELEPDGFKVLDSNAIDKQLFQNNLEKEIIEVLSVITNHRFFKYEKGNHWSIITPALKFEDLGVEQRKLYENQYSSWCIGGYVYPGLSNDLIIDKFTETEFPEVELFPYLEYFKTDPVENKDGIITFPDTIEFCLLNYFNLKPATQNKVKSAIRLINNGIELSEKMRSVAFLCFVSSIETMISLEMNDDEIEFCPSCKTLIKSKYSCEKCNKPIWGVRKKFVEYLKKFVAGSAASQKKYKKIYDLRSNIAHNGQLFLSDLDSSFCEMKIKNIEWLMKLETLQLARISFVNWLRYKEKANR